MWTEQIAGMFLITLAERHIAMADHLPSLQSSRRPLDFSTRVCLDGLDSDRADGLAFLVLP